MVNGTPVEHRYKLFVGIASLSMMAYGVLTGSSFSIGCGAILAGLLTLWRLTDDVQRGISSSNWGSWGRSENRLAFYSNVSFWGAIALAWLVAGGLTIFGLITVPRP